MANIVHHLLGSLLQRRDNLDTRRAISNDGYPFARVIVRWIPLRSCQRKALYGLGETRKNNLPLSAMHEFPLEVIEARDLRPRPFATWARVSADFA